MPMVALRPAALLVGALVLAANAGCGGATSLLLPEDHDEVENPHPEPGAKLSITDPTGKTTTYSVDAEHLTCEAYAGDAYLVHFGLNGLVAEVKFLPYDGTGEYSSRNVRVHRESTTFPECAGRCSEVDVTDGNTTVASGSNADCIVIPHVGDEYVHVEIDCVGTENTNGAGFRTTGELECLVEPADSPHR